MVVFVIRFVFLGRISFFWREILDWKKVDFYGVFVDGVVFSFASLRFLSGEISWRFVFCFSFF